MEYRVDRDSAVIFSRLFSVAVVLIVALAFSGSAFAQDPTPAPVPVAAPNSFVAGIDISGLDQATALAQVTYAFTQPIVITVEDRAFKLTNASLGAMFGIETAVAEAMARPNGGNSLVATTFKQVKLQRQVDRIMRLTSTKGSVAAWKLGRRPTVRQPKPGFAPSELKVEKQIKTALARPVLRPQQEVLPRVKNGANTTVEQIGYVITISKGERVLRVWWPKSGKAKLRRSFHVAVGAPEFPTPSGLFTIVTMQKDPWWIPPASDWAKDEQPVPPGPSNPLGTRWMGLDRQDVGIHGTPDSGSLGQYASHGCIRMAIPSAELVYSWVDQGTPVIIY